MTGQAPRPSPTGRYRAALAGQTPAETLRVDERERLVATLHRCGWTDAQIAAHTRMTLYTTGRIRTRLGLKPHPPESAPTAAGW